MRSQDRYSQDVSNFLNALAYRNPRDQWALRKMTLLDTLGMIRSVPDEIEYLKRNLPPYEVLGSNYQVELVVNGIRVETLQVASIANPPVVTIEFVDSVYEKPPQPPPPPAEGGDGKSMPPKSFNEAKKRILRLLRR